MAEKDEKDTRRELFKTWRNRVKVAKRLHKEKVIDQANKVFKEYAGEHRTNMDTGEKYTLIAQVVQSIEESIQPHLFFQNPTFHAKAKMNKSKWEAREEPVAMLVNHEYQDMKDSGYGIELENELAILDARLLPFGVTETCYEVNGDIILEKPDTGILEQMRNVVSGREDSIERPVIESERQITERVNPLDVYLDYRADHITKQKFVIRKKDVTKKELEKPRYDSKVVERMEPNVNLFPRSKNDDDNSRDFEKLKDDPDFRGFRIYEIEDLENRQIHTIGDGVDEFLEFASPHPLAEGSKYTFLWFMEKPNSVYPIPPINSYRKRANEFSYIYSTVSEQIDKFLPKIFIDKSRLDKPDQQKLQMGTLGAMVGVNGSTAGVANEFSPSINPDIFKYMAMIKELLNLESGVSDYELANPEERKATEAAIIQKATRARRFKPQKRVKGFLIGQSHKIWQILKKNAPFEHFVRVLGEKEATEWWNDPETGKQTWTDENLSGDYWFTYDVESVAPQDELVRKQQNNESLARVLDPNLKLALASEGNKLKVTPIFEKYVKENLGIRDVGKVIEESNVPSPGDEHTAWMNGQFPPVTPEEADNPEKLQEHLQAHQAFINSQGFKMLPVELQEQGLSHVEQTLAILSRSAPGKSVATNAPSAIPPSIASDRALSPENFEGGITA